MCQRLLDTNWVDTNCKEKILDTILFFRYDAKGVSKTGGKMEKIVEQSLLFDFYGSLLTEHQQRVYQDTVFNDMSLSEAADIYGISRQGIHDLLKRCEKTMQEYEDKLQLISRFSTIREKLSGIQELSRAMADSMDEGHLQTESRQINRLAAEILEEL